MPAEEQRKAEEAEELKRKQEEEARKLKEAEELKRKQEEARKLKKAEELKRKQEEEARKLKKAEELKRKQEEEARKLKEAEELKRKQEEEARKLKEAEELKRKQEEEDRKLKEAEELKRKQEEEDRKLKEAEELKRKQAKEDKEDQEESEKPHKKRRHRHQHQEEKPENSESQDDQVLPQGSTPVEEKKQLAHDRLTQKQQKQLAKPVYEFFLTKLPQDFNSECLRPVLREHFNIGKNAPIGLFWPNEDGEKRRMFWAKALSLPKEKRTTEAATARRWILGKMSDEVPTRENEKTKACREKRQELLKEIKGYLSEWDKLDTTKNSDDNNETLDLMLECFKSPEMTQFLKDEEENKKSDKKSNGQTSFNQLAGNAQSVILEIGKRKQNPSNKGTSSQATSNHQEKNNKRKGPDTPSFSQPNASKQSVKPGIEEKINGSSQEGTSNMSSQKEKTTNEKDSGSNVDKNVAHSQPVVNNTLPKPVGFSKQQNVEIRTNSQPPKATQAVKSQENKVQENLSQATKKDQTENQVTVQNNVASQKTVSSGKKIHSSLLMVAEDYRKLKAEEKARAEAKSNKDTSGGHRVVPSAHNKKSSTTATTSKSSLFNF